MRDLKQYIAINRWFMTSNEMAEELGVPLNRVSYVLTQNKWEAVSVADRIREYLDQNPDAEVKDVAEKFGRSVQAVYAIQGKLKEQGLDMPEKIEPVKKDKGPLAKQRKEWMEWVKEEGYGYVPMKKKDRVKEAYTQSGSPFGLADRLRKIKIRG